MATLQDYRNSARDRGRRHRERKKAVGEVRVGVTLPAGLLAALDAAKGDGSRSAVVVAALKLWLEVQVPPPAPARKPVPKKPAPELKKPARKPTDKPARTRRPRRATT